LDAFLVINREQRKQAEMTKREIGAKTADVPLWEGPFVQPRNTKVFSNFAETRTYVYDGRPVDTQVHFGYDLASTKHSPVPAANSPGGRGASPLRLKTWEAMSGPPIFKKPQTSRKRPAASSRA